MISSTQHLAWRVSAAAGCIAALALAGCSSGDTAGGNASSAAGHNDSAAAQPSGAVDAAATAALPAKYKKKGVILYADSPDNPPMEYQDSSGKITGFDVDLAKALSTKLGVTMKFNQQSFDTSIPSLKAGKNDVILAGMNDTVEREKVLDFVDYFHAGFMIVVKKGNPEKIGTVLDLCGKTVAVQKATVQGQLLKSYASKCKAKGAQPINVSQLPSELEAQTAVRSDKATADVTDASVAAYAATTAGGGKTFELVKDADNPSGYNPVYTGIGLLKGNDGLVKALRLAVDSVIKDGTYTKLLKKYGLSDFAVEKAGVNGASK